MSQVSLSLSVSLARMHPNAFLGTETYRMVTEWFNVILGSTEAIRSVPLKEPSLVPNPSDLIVELCSVLLVFTFSHFADAFIQSDLQLGNT